MSERSEKEQWTLQDTYADGSPKWFWKMTGIGPAATPDVAQRAIFASKQEAMQCPAYLHSMSFYEPVKVPA